MDGPGAHFGTHSCVPGLAWQTPALQSPCWGGGSSGSRNHVVWGSPAWGHQGRLPGGVSVWRMRRALYVGEVPAFLSLPFRARPLRLPVLPLHVSPAGTPHPCRSRWGPHSPPVQWACLALRVALCVLLVSARPGVTTVPISIPTAQKPGQCPQKAGSLRAEQAQPPRRPPEASPAEVCEPSG